jgi:hypothetical protein
VVIAVAIPDNVVKSIWNWLVGRIWKSLEMTAREALECCNLSLMSDSGVSAEDQNAARNFYIKECTYNASDGNKDNIRNWTWAIHVIFWQRICLHFVCFLTFLVKMNLKAMSYLIW